jgi:hypothetical protein
VTAEGVRDVRNFFHRAGEHRFVRFRWLVEAGDFSHELQRSGAHFVRRDGRVEIVERFDIPAHERLLALAKRYPRF